MAPPGADPTTQQKKRTRKRKRRVASSSSESDSDSSSSSSSAPAARRAAPKPPPAPASSSSESDSDSSSDDADAPAPAAPAAPPPRARSPSPPPAAHPVPPFDPAEEADAALRARFRKFWMASVADAFQGDLEVLRKEPAMTKSRLAVLIDSLASGADVFAGSGGDVNEMEVVLGDE